MSASETSGLVLIVIALVITFHIYVLKSAPDFTKKGVVYPENVFYQSL